LLTVTDPLNQQTRFEYDDLNRQISRTDTMYRTTHYGYDAVGNMTETTNRNGQTRTFTFDALNRPVQEDWLVNGASIRTFNYGYDAVGNLITTSDPSSRYTMAYDALRRVTTMDNNGTPGMPATILTLGYDAVGNQTSITDNVGVQVNAVYNSRDLITSMTWQGNGHINPARIDFAYNAIGERIETSRYSNLAGTTRIGRSDYTYNVLGQLTSLNHRDASDTVFADYDYSYDAARQLSSETINGITSNYQYDATGQLTNIAKTGQSPVQYTYDNNGNRTGAGHFIGQNNQMNSDGTFNYTYDNEGNLIHRVSISSGVADFYTYDFRGRLTRVEQRNSGGALLHQSDYTYDSLDRRIGIVADGVVTRTVYHGNAPWADYNNLGFAKARYLAGPVVDELLARSVPGQGTAWYLADRLETIRDIVNASGTVIDHIEYDNFGKVTSETNPGFGDRFKYTGREYDAATGLYYFRARYYDPGQGRFISQDPIGFGGNDFNLYRFVHNSPTNATDPSGNSAIVESTVRFLYIPALIGGLAYDCCMIQALAKSEDCGFLPPDTIRKCITEAMGASAVAALVSGGIAFAAAYRVSAVASVFVKTSLVILGIAATGVKTASDLNTAISAPSHEALGNLLCDALAIGSLASGPPKGGKPGGGPNSSCTTCSPASDPNAPPSVLYHYTSEAGYEGILASGNLRPSIGFLNARYGPGQYLTDLAPGTVSSAKLGWKLFGNPFAGKNYPKCIAVDVSGLTVKQGRSGVYVVPGTTPLPIGGRLTTGTGPSF